MCVRKFKREFMSEIKLHASQILFSIINLVKTVGKSTRFFIYFFFFENFSRKKSNYIYIKTKSSLPLLPKKKKYIYNNQPTPRLLFCTIRIWEVSRQCLSNSFCHLIKLPKHVFAEQFGKPKLCPKFGAHLIYNTIYSQTVSPLPYHNY